MTSLIDPIAGRIDTEALFRREERGNLRYSRM
jgi:hypothetical protein